MVLIIAKKRLMKSFKVLDKLDSVESVNLADLVSQQSYV